MKKLMLLLLTAALALTAAAHDFDYEYEGQTLTYTVLDEDAKTCMTKEGTHAGAANPVVGDLTIPSIAKDGDAEYTVTAIGQMSFYQCRTLTSVTLPNTVTTIGKEAFYFCTSLTSIRLSNSLTTIDEQAFTMCSRLASVELPSSVTYIGIRAFMDCEGITSIVIPASVAYIGEGVFSQCRKLESIEVSAENAEYASVDGVMFNKDLSTLLSYPGGKAGSYAIPVSVTSIGNSAFEQCRNLTMVDIPTSVTSIGKYAFSNSYLTAVEIPSSVVSIGDRAFYSCSNLESIAFSGSSSVESIGEMAFYLCSKLESVEIPALVEHIGERAFSNCSKLVSIEVAAENPCFASLDGVLFNKDLSTLIQYPSGLTAEEYDIPASVTVIGPDAFARNVSLKSMVIPVSVTYIGDDAFLSCRGLTMVDIPASVTYIGEEAFYLCRDLVSVYYRADDPIAASEYAFYSSTYENGTLYMTEAGAEKARDINPWSKFANIEVYDFPDGIADAQIAADAPCEIYTLSGAKAGNSTTSLAPGIYILRQGSTATKIAIK